MTKTPKGSLPSGTHDWASDYILSSDELRSSGVDLNTYPGAVFFISGDACALTKISSRGIDAFGITPEILDHMLMGRMDRVFFPEGLRRLRPSVEELIRVGDGEGVARAILEYRAQRSPRYVHVALRLLPRFSVFFGLAQYIPPSSWPANVIQSKARSFRTKMLDRFRSLTNREREVLRSMVAGYSNQQIADVLNISVNTVKTHKKNVNVKLDIAHYGDLIKFAVAFDLVEFD